MVAADYESKEVQPAGRPPWSPANERLAAPRKPHPSNALLVVAKRPTPGRTKTRLTPPLSQAQAAALYECFLQDTLNLIRQAPNVQPVIAYLPPESQAYFAQLAPDFDHIQQRGANLGTRLDNALRDYLKLGYQRAVIMNSDGPSLPLTYLVDAFEVLAGEADVVLGPCNDGGYYLIGLKHPAPRLFREAPMSTPNVTANTLALAAEEGLKVKMLPAWYDVDDVDSLARLAAELLESPFDIACHTRTFLKKQPKLVDLLVYASKKS